MMIWGPTPRAARASAAVLLGQRGPHPVEQSLDGLTCAGLVGVTHLVGDGGTMPFWEGAVALIISDTSTRPVHSVQLCPVRTKGSSVDDAARTRPNAPSSVERSTLTDASHARTDRAHRGSSGF